MEHENPLGPWGKIFVLGGTALLGAGVVYALTRPAKAAGPAPSSGPKFTLIYPDAAGKLNFLPGKHYALTLFKPTGTATVQDVVTSLKNQSNLDAGYLAQPPAGWPVAKEAADLHLVDPLRFFAVTTGGATFINVADNVVAAAYEVT